MHGLARLLPPVAASGPHGTSHAADRTHGPRTAPRAAPTERLCGGPARFGRRPTLCAHTAHAGRRGRAVCSGRRGRAAACSRRNGPTGHCAAAASAALGGGLAAASRRPGRLRGAASELARVRRGIGVRLVQRTAGHGKVRVLVGAEGHAHAWVYAARACLNAPPSVGLSAWRRGWRRRSRPRQRAHARPSSSRSRWRRRSRAWGHLRGYECVVRERTAAYQQRSLRAAVALQQPVGLWGRGKRVHTGQG